MLRFLTTIVIILLPIPSIFGQNEVDVRVVSPMPQTQYHSPQSVIIFQLNQKSDLQNVAAMCKSVEIEGETSGKHSFEVLLAKDRQTLNLKPVHNFTSSEKVRVRFGDASFSLEDFWFQISENNGGGALYAIQPQTQSACPEVEEGLPDYETHYKSGEVDSLPLGFPNIGININAGADTNYLFFSTRAHGSGSYYIILDGNGQLFRYAFSPHFGGDFKVQANGQITYYDGALRQHYILDEYLNVIDSLTMIGYIPDGHELQITPNGNALMMCYDTQIIDMSAIVPGGEPQAGVTGVVLQELDPSGALVFQWRSWDHFQITDGVRMDFTQPNIQYVHANSLQYDTDGNIIMSSRHMDEITKIDRNTGNVIWRLGGKNNMFTFIDDPLMGFRAQHHARRIENGNLTIFDNGFYHSPPRARAVEYTLDETNFTATLVWEYRSTPPVLSRAMGSVQRLQNGNTIIGWGLSLAHVPMATEVDAAGFKTFEFILDIPDASYRVLRFPLSDFVTSINATQPPDFVNGPFDLKVYPNILQAGESAAISFYAPENDKVRLRLLNAAGEVLQQLPKTNNCNNGICALRWAVPYLPKGVYFLQIRHSNGRHEAQRLLIR